MIPGGRTRKGTGRRRLLWAFAAIVGLGLAAALLGTLWFNAYLRSDRFRQLLSEVTARRLKAVGEYLPFQFTGSTIYSDRFEARGTTAAPFSSLRADQLRAELNPAGALRRTWQIDEVDVQRLEVSFRELDRRLPSSIEVPRETTAARRRNPLARWLPTRVDLRKATVRETMLEWGATAEQTGSLTGATFTITPDGQAWNIEGTGGQVVQSSLPPLRLGEARLRYQSPSLFVTNALFHYGDVGTVQVSGEAQFERDLDLRIALAGIPITPFLTEDWRLRLKGNMQGDLRVRMAFDQAGAIQLQGTVGLTEGHLEALPILDQIALFTRTQQFRRLALNNVSGKFVREKARLTVSDFVAESEGLIRVEGAFVIENSQIDGAFQVGVTAASLQWLPGSQARVFTEARNGYLWAPMRLAGPLDNPSDDLKPRLIAAAQGAVIEGAESVVRDAAKELIDAPKKVRDLLDRLTR